MKKDEICRVVTTSFKRIEKLFHKIIIDFETEDIQEFRIEIKKLRAFFHLLDMESEQGIPFKITRKMKTFYGYIGIIRNLQIHLKKINTYFENSTENIPVSYIVKLEKELEYWKKYTKEFMDLHNNFYDDGERIIAELPDRLRKISIEKFIHYIVYELQELLNHLDSDDEALHRVRKFLEDIVYNRVYLQPYIGSLLTGSSHQEEIESFIEMLGVFRDKCIDLTLLQTYQDDSTEHDEIILHKIIHIWEIQKQELKQIIYDWLDLMQLRPMKILEPASIDNGSD